MKGKEAGSGAWERLPFPAPGTLGHARATPGPRAPPAVIAAGCEDIRKGTHTEDGKGRWNQ